MSEITLSRRDFLAFGLTALGSAAVSFYTRTVYDAIEKSHDYFTNLDYLDGIQPSPNPLPKSLQGLTINSPFLYNQDSKYIDWVKARTESVGAGNIRMFMGNLFEQSLGGYNDRVIDDIKRTADHLGDINLIVSLFDSYPLLHSDKPNLDYKTGELDSPYFFASSGETKTQKQLDFFRNPKIISAVDKRFEHTIKRLKDVGQISAWEIGNEFMVPDVEGINRKELLTGWYEERIKTVRAFDGGRPIITGLSFPWLIDEKRFVRQNIVNSFHAYPLQPWVTSGLSEFVPNSLLPLAGLEVGVGENLKPVVSYPLYIYHVLNSVISNKILYAGGIGLWKLDKGEDGYDISKENAGYLRLLSEKLRAI